MTLFSFLEWLQNKLDALYYHSVKHQFAFVGNGVYVGRLSQLVGARNIHLADSVSIGKGSCLCAWSNYQGQTFNPKVFLDKGVIIGPNAHITSISSIHIGENTLIGKWVTITDNSHGQTFSHEFYQIPPLLRHLETKGEVIIGKNVWIGDKATILPGVIVGDGAVIGANAVVTKSVPPCCVAVGNPAKIIENRNKNI